MRLKFSRFAVYHNLLDYWAAGPAIGANSTQAEHCQLPLTFIYSCLCALLCDFLLDNPTQL